MKLIIDIDEETYENCKAWAEVATVFSEETKAIAQGIPYEERPQGEWIPVSERLPEEGNTSYLVTVDYGDNTFSCQRFFFNDEIGWNDYSVIAWMPLPEPYQEAAHE